MVSMKDIRAFAGQIAKEFKPRRIILFGSYAHGSPRRDSDVDLLIVMRYRGRSLRKAVEILRLTNPSFAVDLIVGSPEEIRLRIAEEDWFMCDIMKKGRVLYEKNNARMDQKGRR